MSSNPLIEFSRAALNLVERKEGLTKKIIGYSYFISDVAVAFTSLIKHSSLQSLADGGSKAALLWQGLSGRPLPVLASALWIVASLAMTRGKFTASNVAAGSGSATMIADFVINHEYWSITPMVVGLTGAAIGVFHRPLERQFSQAQSALLQNTLGRPKQVTGLLFSINSYPLLVSSILDHNPAMFAASVGWSFGSTLMMCLPRDIPRSTTLDSMPLPSPMKGPK